MNQSSTQIIEQTSQTQSDSFNQNQVLPQNKQIYKYYDNKQCQVCLDIKNFNDMVLCDRCDDGFHYQCLNKTKDQINNIEWICPNCLVDIKLQQKKTLNKKNHSQQHNQKKKYCQKCQQDIYKPQTLQYLKTNQSSEMIKGYFLLQGIQPVQCLYCKKWYHLSCFNIRQDCLNCQECDKMILKKSPKGHKFFVQYYMQQIQILKESKFLSLQTRQDSPLLARKKPRPQQAKLFLVLPLPVTNWQLITQYQSSIHYSFISKKLTYICNQIYPNEQTLQKNNPIKDYSQILPLNKDDQMIFRQFKKNQKDGIVGPYEIKMDRVRGFHVVATDFIHKMTLICQYVGEVMTQRQSLIYQNNDSIFILIKNMRSSLSLDIVPNHFSNIGRFFLGINNTDKKAQQHINVATVRFALDNRVRIAFYTKSNIQAGDVLYFDYNGSKLNQYPTEHFVK